MVWPTSALPERIGGAGRAGDVDPVALPLVADRAEPVGIRQRVRRRQDLVLLRRAADRHRPGRRIVDVISDGIARRGIAGRIADLRGEQVVAVAERDVGAPRAAADGGDTDLGHAIENSDRGVGIGAGNSAGEGQARLVGLTARVADRHHRCGGVKRDHVGRSDRAIARRITELGRDRLGTIGPEVAGDHGQADAAGDDVRRRDGVGHRMRQSRTTQQQLNPIAGHDRRTERHCEGRRRHIGYAVSMRRPGVPTPPPEPACRRSASPCRV